MAKKNKLTDKLEQFYKIKNILSKDALYNIIYGRRSNGKSYAVKEFIMEEAIVKDRLFMLMFRRESDRSTNAEIEKYFSDMGQVIGKLTKGEYDRIKVRSKDIYLYKIEEDEEVEVQDKKTGEIKLKTIKGKKIWGPRLGHIMFLDQEAGMKSSIFENVYNLLFEEFVSSDSYLIDEVTKFQSAVSTVFRMREGCRVFLVGNLLSRVNPYRSEWGLKRLDRQKPGTIDVYTFEGAAGPIKVAVEYTETKGIFQSFAISEKAKQQEAGEWETGVFLTPNNVDLSGFVKAYEFVYCQMGFYFLCEFLVKGADMIVYITTKTTPIQDKTRVIGDIPSLSILYTSDFKPLVERERIVFDLINQGKLVFGDNLTGADFTNCYKTMKKGRR